MVFPSVLPPSDDLLSDHAQRIAPPLYEPRQNYVYVKSRTLFCPQKCSTMTCCLFFKNSDALKVAKILTTDQTEKIHEHIVPYALLDRWWRTA